VVGDVADRRLQREDHMNIAEGFGKQRQSRIEFQP
jgi:hypothetical protein